MDTVSLNKLLTHKTNPVLLDTNALIMPFQFSIDIGSELTRLLGVYTILVPSSVIDELKKLSERHPIAMGALKLAKRYPVVPVEQKGDEGILKLAMNIGATVVTNDVKLRKSLKKHKIRVIYMREKSRLEMM